MFLINFILYSKHPHSLSFIIMYLTFTFIRHTDSRMSKANILQLFILLKYLVNRNVHTGSIIFSLLTSLLETKVRAVWLCFCNMKDFVESVERWEGNH